jgi:hypothetical protein
MSEHDQGKNSPLDPKYVAGLFDGEGCIVIAKRKPGARHRGRGAYYTLRATIAMTHEETVRRLHETFGGYNGRMARAPEGHADIFQWQLATTPQAARFLRLIEPFSITKRQQIAVALSFARCIRDFNGLGISRGGPGRFRAQFATRQYEMHRQLMMAVNKRGPKELSELPDWVADGSNQGDLL